jgi:hypothetical protein
MSGLASGRIMSARIMSTGTAEMRKTTTTAVRIHRGAIGIAVVTVLALIAAALALYEAGADTGTMSLFIIGACSFGFGLMRRPRSRD